MQKRRALRQADRRTNREAGRQAGARTGRQKCNLQVVDRDGAIARMPALSNEQSSDGLAPRWTDPKQAPVAVS